MAQQCSVNAILQCTYVRFFSTKNAQQLHITIRWRHYTVSSRWIGRITKVAVSMFLSVTQFVRPVQSRLAQWHGKYMCILSNRSTVRYVTSWCLPLLFLELSCRPYLTSPCVRLPMCVCRTSDLLLYFRFSSSPSSSLSSIIGNSGLYLDSITAQLSHRPATDQWGPFSSQNKSYVTLYDMTTSTY